MTWRLRSSPAITSRLQGALRAALVLGLAYATGGCATLTAQRATPSPPTQNPFFVAANNEEAVWERTVDVVHRYFDIARENRLDGVIETQPKVGASLLEPWHRDAVGAAERLEGSLQSVRRRAFVRVTPTSGGYLVGVEVFKEREDVARGNQASPGGATFQESRPLQRDLTLVEGQATPLGWVSLGRDHALEERMLDTLRTQFAP